MRGSGRHLADTPLPRAHPPDLPGPRSAQGPPGGADGASLATDASPGPVDEGDVTEVIRPAAIVPERAARAILAELALADVGQGGLWQATTSHWSRWDRPWSGDPEATDALRIGTIQVAYGTPTRYEITIYRVTVTRHGQENGWSVELLTDEALGFGGLTLAECPRASLGGVPRPFRY